MKRRAAFVTPGAFPVPSSLGGSVERVVEKFVPCLAPHVEARIYGRIGRKLPARGLLNGVEIERYPAASKKRYFKRVCRGLARFRPHTIQVENRPLWVPRLKRRFPGSRVWLNLHSITFISPPYLSRSQRKTCLQAADRIIVNSGFLRSYIHKRVPSLGGKIRVNHLGVDAARFPGRSSAEGKKLREQGRAARGWGNRKVVLFVGRLIKQKGVHHLLSALPDIVAKHPDVLLVIVGSALYGSHRKTAYARSLHAAASRWKKHVHFQPYIPHHEVPRWFAMADIAVVPSIGREAFGLVNVEAMAAELPVVATKAGGMKEVIADGSTGYLVTNRAPGIVNELSAKINDLLGNEQARTEMGKRGRERVLGHFLWEHTAQRWLNMQKE